eukprot:gene22146-29208_t
MLLNRYISGRDWINDRPLAESFSDMVSQNLAYEHHFVKEMVLSSPPESVINIQLEEVFEKLKDWLDVNVSSTSLKDRHNTTIIKFGQKMTKLMATTTNTGFEGVLKKRTKDGVSIFAFESDCLYDDDKQLAIFRVADPSLKTEYCKRDDVVDAFIWMVVDAYKPYLVVQSSVVKDDTRSFLEDAGDDLTLLREVFKVSEDKRNFVLVADINQWGKLHGMSKTKLQDRLARMGAVKNDQCCIDGVRHGRRFLNLLMGEAV